MVFPLEPKPVCDKLLGRLKAARVLGQGAQGKAFVYKDAVVKQMNLGSYRGETREFVQNYTYRADFEVHAMKKLANTGFVPKYFASWKCHAPKLKPMADNLTGKKKIRPPKGKGYYQAYIKMDRLHGVNLNKHLKAGKKFDKRQLEELVRNVYIMNTKYNIVHTDLHVENIVMSAKGKAYIIDFGLAWRGQYERAALDEDIIYMKDWFLSNKYVKIPRATIKKIFNKYIHKYPGREHTTDAVLNELQYAIKKLRDSDPSKHLDLAFS